MGRSYGKKIQLSILGAQAKCTNSDYNREPVIKFRVLVGRETATGEIEKFYTVWKEKHSSKTGVSKEWKENKTLEIIQKYQNEFMNCYIDDFGNITISDTNVFVKEI